MHQACSGSGEEYALALQELGKDSGFVVFAVVDGVLNIDAYSYYKFMQSNSHPQGTL